MKTIGAVLVSIVLLLAFTLVYAFVAPGLQGVKAAGLAFLLGSPWYWLLLILMICAEVWLWRRGVEMRFIRLLVVALLRFITVIALTCMWILRMSAKAGPGHYDPVDVTYVLTRPVYLLEFVVLTALAVWVCSRWVFA